MGSPTTFTVPTIRAAKIRNLVVYGLGAEISAADMEALGTWKRQQLSEGEQVGTIALLFEAKPMSSEVTEATNRFIREFAPNTRASATVIVAEGFAASAARAMAATLFLVSRVACPRKVFSNVPDAGVWVGSHFDDPSMVDPGVRWLEGLQAEGKAVLAAR